MADTELLPVTQEAAGNRLADAMASAIKRLETIRETHSELCLDDDLQNCRDALASFRRIPSLSDRQAVFNTRPTQGHDALVAGQVAVLHQEAIDLFDDIRKQEGPLALTQIAMKVRQASAKLAAADALINLLTPQAEEAPSDGLEWLNIMPRAVVAKYAWAGGCREQTYMEIHSGLYSGVKLKAEMVVEMIGDLQSDTRTALRSRPSGDGEGE